MSILEVFAEDNVKLLAVEMLENIVGKGENAGFSFSQNIFKGFLLTFPKPQILNTCKLKGFAHYYFKFDKSGRMFSKRVKNTVGKGEIARYEQFLLFPLCFQKTYTADT